MDTEAQDTPSDDETPHEKVGNKVVFAYMFNEHNHGFFTYSALDMFRYDSVYGSKYINHEEGGFIALSTGPRVAEARNQVIDRFAEAHPSADWLFMVDADMTFEGAILEQLMSVADEKERPIVGALCFAGGRSHRTYPTIWREIEIERNEQNQAWAAIEKVYDYPKNALLKVAATGGAALLIHRKVFKRMHATFGKLANGGTNPYPWFAEGLCGPDGQPLGEDVAFCLRARMVGCPVHVHTGIKTGHMKSYEITESYYENERETLREMEGQQGVLDLTREEKQQEQEKPPAMNRAARRAANRKGQG